MTTKNLPALDDLARRIKEEHQACRDAAQSAVDHAVMAGQLLLEAKDGIPHGQWLPWLNGHCDVAERTAQTYMRLARELSKIEPEKAQRVADLPLRQALKELAEPEEAERTKPDTWSVEEPFEDHDFEDHEAFPFWLQWKLSHVAGLPPHIRAALACCDDYSLPALALCPDQDIREALERIAPYVKDEANPPVALASLSALTAGVVLKITAQRIVAFLFEEMTAREKLSDERVYQRAQKIHQQLEASLPCA